MTFNLHGVWVAAQRLIPANHWQRPTLQTLKADLIAGVTVALILVPQSMAYASLAGMPPHYGLYAAFLPVLVAGLWGFSPQLATGPVAVVGLLTASALAPLAEPGSSEYITLAITLALLVGLFQLLLGLFSLGNLVNFLAHPVIIGFTNATAIVIALSQVDDLFGFSVARESGMVAGVIMALLDISKTHLPTLLMGLTAIAIMLISRRQFPRLPGVLIAVILLTPVSYFIGYADMGGEVVGEVPAGIPSLAIPTLEWDNIRALLASAAVIALVGFMEAISIAKAIATKTRERINPNQEVIGQGMANLAAGFSQAMPVGVSFSRSAVNHSNGAKTGMSAVFTALLVALSLLVLTPLLYHLPLSVLAAIIIMAVSNLINVKAMLHTWRTHRQDGAVAVTTFIATLAFAPHLDYGILLGAGLAIVVYLLRTMRPRVVILSRHPKDGTLRDARLFNLPESAQIAALRFDGPLYFANVGHLEERVLQATHDHQQARFVLLVGDGITSIDSSGIETLHTLDQRLRENGVTLVLAGIKLQVWEVMQRAGLDQEIGHDNIFRNEDDAILAIYRRIDDPDFDPQSCPLRPLNYQGR